MTDPQVATSAPTAAESDRAALQCFVIVARQHGIHLSPSS